jgi:hypothetical protein
LSFLFLFVSKPEPCNKFPNSTDTKPAWSICDNVTNDGIIYNIKLQDPKTGKEESTIKLTKPIDVIIDLDMPSEYSDVILDIEIYFWEDLIG